MRLSGVCVAALVVASAAIGTAPAAVAKTRAPGVVFDTDMDYDDASALAYLAARHHAGALRLRAVTVENNGASLPGFAAKHARCLLDVFGLNSVPVAEGPVGVPVWPSLTVGVTAIMVTLVPPCAGSSLPPADGATLLARVAREERDLRIVATGPLTNVAAAMAREPAVLRARQITIMGGELNSRHDPFLDEGLQRDGTQDFNFSSDPAAAHAVIASGLRSLRLVTTSATNDVPMTTAYADRLRAQARSAEARFVSSVADNALIALGNQAGTKSYWWDPLAAVVSDYPPVIARVGASPLSVRVDGSAGGRAEITRSGPRIGYILRARQRVFEDHFLKVLNGG